MPWVHERHSGLESAFPCPEGALADTYETDPETVVYLARGQVELLPLDGGDTPVMVFEAGHVFGALAALTDGAVRFRARARGEIALGEVHRARFLRELERDSLMSLTLARQIVLAHREWRRLAGGAPHSEIEVARGGPLASRTLPEPSFRALVEGLQPQWRVRGSTLFERGSFADAVHLVEFGRLLIARELVELPVLTTAQEMDAEHVRLEESLRARDALVPTGPSPLSLVGYWQALLPVDDPAVSGSRGDGRRGAPQGRGVSGAEEGERRRGPQPERHDVTGVVGRENAVVYSLPRDEFMRRLELDPRLARDVLRQLCVDVALQQMRVVEGPRVLPPEEAAIAQLLRNTRQVSSPPSPIAIA